MAIVHSKGIPLVKPYFAYIGGVSYSVDKWQVWLEIALKSDIISL